MEARREIPLYDLLAVNIRKALEATYLFREKG
jgi:hypothetical protein